MKTYPKEAGVLPIKAIQKLLWGKHPACLLAGFMEKSIRDRTRNQFSNLAVQNLS
ncbi:hypothetical protein [Microcoleus sp. F4-D5]|uniref:hypothetical protein n=1 Tax=Microcoleus sp. F4-D5 TaxID=2818760 RepID=UPI002FD6D26A